MKSIVKKELRKKSTLDKNSNNISKNNTKSEIIYKIY
jgi:hypothetical protein